MTTPENMPQYSDYPDYQQPSVVQEPKRIRISFLEIVGLFMILAAAALLIVQIGVFRARPHVLPDGSTIDDVAVGGLSAGDAEARIRQMYATPVSVLYNDQTITLDPTQVDFTLSINSSLDDAATTNELPELWDYLWQRPAT